MSTNFYADVEIVENVVIKMHIGKRSNGGFSSLSGAHFPDWKTMKAFLVHNRFNVTIRDENNRVVELTDLVAEVEATPVVRRSKDYRWTESNEPTTLTNWDNEPNMWLDDEGFTFHRNYFS